MASCSSWSARRARSAGATCASTGSSKIAARRGSAVPILYEDRELLVLDKPAGLPTIPPDSSRARSLLDAANAIIRARDPAGRAAVVHRVDRDTSGAVLFAKSGRGKRELMSAWNERVVERSYLALVEGCPREDEGRIEDWLIENKAGTVYRGHANERGALRSVTRWRLIESGPRYSLISATLETGRKHQVRVHLASLGLPVAGDERYGARSDPLGRVCLHAAVLEFRHPFSDELIRIESPLPEEFRKVLHAGARKGAAASGGRPAVLDSRSGGAGAAPRQRQGSADKPATPRREHRADDAPDSPRRERRSGDAEASSRPGRNPPQPRKGAGRKPAQSAERSMAKPPKLPRGEAPEWAPRHVKKRP